MTLTTVVGSSGSGKTTFLNDVHKLHKCTYLRQYHTIRPYICVTKIPNFDPTQLPFWEQYVREGTADSIRVGGTMAGTFIAGLSGGQRKLLLFELLFQRTTLPRLVWNGLGENIYKGGRAVDGLADSNGTPATVATATASPSSNNNSNPTSSTSLIARKLSFTFSPFKKNDDSDGSVSSTDESSDSNSSNSNNNDDNHDNSDSSTCNNSCLLLVLDEPFAGVTDDFVPYIVQRLNLMRRHHNILVVTNDHVHALTDMADNTITVSAIDRTRVQIHNSGHNGNNNNHMITDTYDSITTSNGTYYDREKTIMALSVGDEYEYSAVTNEDLWFFWSTEVVGSGGIMTVLAFVIVTFGMFTMTFWNSEPNSAPLVLIAGGSISFFVISPYLLSLVDWRNYISEEAEALLHSSKGMNKFLKTMLTLFLMFLISILQYGVFQCIIDNLSGWDFWLAIFFDSASLQFPFICFGIYTKLQHQIVEILSGTPVLLMIFFSTTYSPGAGIPIIKELRYLFARYYMFCMTPIVNHLMEDCPADPNVNLLLLILSGCLCVLCFVVFMTIVRCSRKHQRKHIGKKLKALKDDQEYIQLQMELYGPAAAAATNMKSTTTTKTKTTTTEFTSPPSSSHKNVGIGKNGFRHADSTDSFKTNKTARTSSTSSSSSSSLAWYPFSSGGGGSNVFGNTSHNHVINEEQENSASSISPFSSASDSNSSSSPSESDSDSSSANSSLNVSYQDEEGNEYSLADVEQGQHDFRV